MKNFSYAGFAAACFALAISPAFASENGGSNYPHGAENWGAGALPPPGTYALIYGNYYGADELNDRNGDNMVPDFQLDAFALVNRVVHVTDKKILGATYAMHAIVPIVDLNVKAGGVSSHDTSIGDIIIDPLILGWKFDDVHVTTGLEIFIPTGDYDRRKLANVGRNYWSFQPVVAVSYLNKDGVDLSAKFMADFNTRNNATEYRSGNQFHVDFAAGKTFQNGLGVGAAGYFLRQFSDDKISDIRVGPDGNKAKAFALGPTVKYQAGKMQLMATWQKELSSRNRPQGDKFWLRLIAPL